MHGELSAIVQKTKVKKHSQGSNCLLLATLCLCPSVFLLQLLTALMPTWSYRANDWEMGFLEGHKDESLCISVAPNLTPGGPKDLPSGHPPAPWVWYYLHPSSKIPGEFFFLLIAFPKLPKRPASFNGHLQASEQSFTPRHIALC